MKSRRETHKRKKLPFKKILIGTVLLIALIGSSVSVVFADQDIESLLSNWFHENQVEAVDELEKSVKKEKDVQTKRLKEELQSEVEKAEDELAQFTEHQKDKVSSELKKHVDNLINSSNINDAEKREDIEASLNKILTEAKEKMNAIDIEFYEEASNETQIKEEPKEDEKDIEESNKDDDNLRNNEGNNNEEAPEKNNDKEEEQPPVDEKEG